MLDKNQLHAELKQQAKDQIFEKQFNFALNQRLSKATEEAAKLYSEKVDRNKYTVVEDKKLTRFSIPNDDQHRTKMWDSLMTDCAFYYDNPTIDQERKMKQTLQFRYDELLRAGWRPALQSRNDLVQWAC